MKIQTLIAAAVMASSTGLMAQTYTWRPGDVLGGTGTWDTTTANWNTGPQVTWPSTGTANEAVFGTTAGTVTISGGVTANKLTFNTDGYTVQSSTLTFNGTTPTVSISSGTVTLQSVLLGSGGLTKTGAGTLVIQMVDSVANTLSGALAVNAGTLVVEDYSTFNPNIGYALNSITSIVVDNATMSLQATQNALTASDTPKPITIQNGGILSADKVGKNVHKIWDLTLNGGTLATGGSVTASGNFALDGNVTVGGSTVSTISANVGLGSNNFITFSVSDSVSGSGTDLLVSGILAGTDLSIIKSGVGTMELSEANTYSGTTTINEGVLRLASTGSFAAEMSTLGFGVNDSGSGVLQVENSAFSFIQTISLALASVTLTNGSWNLFTGSQFGPGDLKLAGLTSDLGGFVENAGVWELTDGNGRDWTFNESTGQLLLVP